MLVEVRHKPLAIDFLHVEPVLLSVFVVRIGAVLPHLADGQERYGMRRVLHFHGIDAEVGYRAAVSGDEVVEPLVVHRFVLGQVEHRVEQGIEVVRHVVSGAFQQLVVGNVLA